MIKGFKNSKKDKTPKNAKNDRNLIFIISRNI